MSEPNPEYIDPTRLFAQYAFPCIKLRVDENRLNCSLPKSLRRSEGEVAEETRQLIELQRITETGNIPSWKLLEKCFPRPIAAIAVFAEESGHNPKSFEAVSNWWRSHQGEGGECRVRHEKIVLTQPTICTLRGDTQCFLPNPFNLAVQTGSWVYTHILTIVEVPPPRTRPHAPCRPR